LNIILTAKNLRKKNFRTKAHKEKLRYDAKASLPKKFYITLYYNIFVMSVNLKRKFLSLLEKKDVEFRYAVVSYLRPSENTQKDRRTHRRVA
jgi:hypothetical protein